MAKIYRVIQIKMNQLVQENVHMITDLATKHIQVLSQWQTLSTFLPTRWRQKPTGTDMEQNYVSVTLCIQRDKEFHRPVALVHRAEHQYERRA